MLFSKFPLFPDLVIVDTNVYIELPEDEHRTEDAPRIPSEPPHRGLPLWRATQTHPDPPHTSLGKETIFCFVKEIVLMLVSYGGITYLSQFISLPE